MSRSYLPRKKPVLRPAQELIAAALARSGFRMEDQIIFELWDATLGADAARAPAVALKSGKLFVTVDTPVRLHTLTLRKRELLKKMNVALGAQGPLSDIILRLGTVSPSDDNA